MLRAMKPNSEITSPAALRIIETAMDLFYRQGYRFTGVNEVIEKSGVAKATFYKHFPTKDDLGRTYLQFLRDEEVRGIEAFIEKQTTPRDRFLAPIRMMVPWIRAHEYRGCGFLNMVAEVPDPRDPLRKEAASLYKGLSKRVRQLAEELVASDPKRYGHLDLDQVTEAYLVAFMGGLALAAMYDDNWPVKRAVQIAENLID